MCVPFDSLRVRITEGRLLHRLYCKLRGPVKPCHFRSDISIRYYGQLNMPLSDVCKVRLLSIVPLSWVVP